MHFIYIYTDLSNIILLKYSQIFVLVTVQNYRLGVGGSNVTEYGLQNKLTIATITCMILGGNSHIGCCSYSLKI